MENLKEKLEEKAINVEGFQIGPLGTVVGRVAGPMIPLKDVSEILNLKISDHQEDIYSRPECTFHYCPHPSLCKKADKCHCEKTAGK